MASYPGDDPRSRYTQPPRRRRRRRSRPQPYDTQRAGTPYDPARTAPPVQAPRPVVPGPAPDTQRAGAPYDPARTGPAAPAASGQPPAVTYDFNNFLRNFGMPAELQAKVDQMVRAGKSPQEILAYVRGTDWYKATYPGINEAIAKGIVANEKDYRQYLNTVNQASQRYLGRDVTVGEFGGYISQGLTPDVIEKKFAGTAYAHTYRPEIQYEAGAFGAGQLSTPELQSYGEQQAGLPSALGLRLQKALDQAAARYAGAFAGRTNNPSLSLGGAGLQEPSLNANRRPTDVSA